MCKEYDDDDMILVIAKLIWSCEMRVTSECNTYVMWRSNVDWYVCSCYCMENHQVEGLHSIANKSVLYVYLFLEELIV